MTSSGICAVGNFAMVVVGGAETAFADISYSFTTIAVPGAGLTQALGISEGGQIV